MFIKGERLRDRDRMKGDLIPIHGTEDFGK